MEGAELLKRVWFWSLSWLCAVTWLCTVPLCVKDAEAKLSRKERRKRYRRYRKLRSVAYKSYRKAKRRWWRQPCEAHRRLGAYLGWLVQAEKGVDGHALAKYQRKGLLRRYKRYARWSKRLQRKIFRYCRRYWRKEFKRNPHKLRKACQSFVGDKGVTFGVGVRPWAYLYLNGKLCGTAPIQMKLVPGTYRVRLAYPPGRDQYRTTVQLEKKSHLLVHEMKNAPKAKKDYEGLLAPKQLRFVLKQHRSSLQSCQIYAPKVAKVVLSWKISTKGKPEAVRWVEPVESNKRFQRCILRAVGRWRFPPLKGTAQIHAYPIVLQKEKEPED